jgi:acyl-CoA synthetase (AMP-forming)/AMP-acid ligase II
VSQALPKCGSFEQWKEGRVENVDVGTRISSSGQSLDPDNWTIYEVVKSHAIKNPAAVAVTMPHGSPLSYGRLFQHIEKTLGTLRTLGVNKNDRVAIVLPNGPEMAVAFVSVAGGATCAPLNAAYRASEFDFYLSDLDARALIIASGMASPARDVATQRNIPIIELVSTSEASGAFELEGTVSRPTGIGDVAAPDDIALVLHTSGTTSRPKMVPLTQANVCASGRHIARTLALAYEDRCLNVMPLFHIHGLIGAVLSSLTAGGSIACTP